MLVYQNFLSLLILFVRLSKRQSKKGKVRRARDVEGVRINGWNGV